METRVEFIPKNTNCFRSPPIFLEREARRLLALDLQLFLPAHMQGCSQRFVLDTIVQNAARRHSRRARMVF